MKVSIDIPKEMYDQARAIAESQHMSVEDVCASAFAERFTCWQRLGERAARGNREKFLAALDTVPDVEPDEYDRIESS